MQNMPPQGGYFNAKKRSATMEIMLDNGQIIVYTLTNPN